MPKKQYEYATNQQLLLNFVQSDMVESHMAEHQDWDTGFKESTDHAVKKRQDVLNFIGYSLTDEQFSALEDKLQQDVDTAALFDRICTELTSNEIIKNKEVLLKAVAGNLLNLPEKEAGDAFEQAGKLCTNAKAEKRYKEERIKLKTDKMIADEKQTISLGVRSLADSAYDEKKGADPCADDPKRREQYIKTAAKVIAAYTVGQEKELPSVQSLGYDYNAFVNEFDDRASRKKEYEQNLLQDQDFAAFVQEYRVGKDASKFKPEYMIESWKNYREALLEEKTQYVKFTEYAKGNLKKDDATYKAPYIMFNMANLVDDDFDKNDIKQTCKELLEQNSTQLGVSKKDFLKVANLIVADTLLSPASDKAFFESDKVKSNGVPDILKLNKAVIELREQIIHDPIFQDVINSRPTYKNVVAEYKAAVRKEVNKKISNEKAQKEAFKKDPALLGQYETYTKENTLELSNEEFDRIKETRENLKKYNEGKKPSDHMKRLTDALDEVIRQKEEGKNPKLGALEELNSAALNYYNKRQGIIFSPITDDGKARLSAVEKLTFTTEKLANRCKESFRQSQVQIKQEPMKM